MPETPENSAARLAEILERQLALYCAVRELAVKGRQLIVAKDTSGLMEVLAEKKEKIAAIDALGREAESWRRIWEETHAGLPEEVRAPVEKVVEDLRAVLADILAIEDEGQKNLRAAKEGTGAEIAKLQKGKALHKAYGGVKPPANPQFKDKTV